MYSDPASPLRADDATLDAPSARLGRIAWRRTFGLTGCLGAGILATLVLLAAPVGSRSIAVPVFLVGVSVVFGAGFSDLPRVDRRWFGRALISGGVLWSASTLSASNHAGLYTLGRICEWMVQLVVLYLLLSYPSGLLTEKVPRTLFAGGLLVLGVLFVPSVLLVQHLPQPGPWSSCRTGCPTNAFALGSATPGWVHDLVIPLREALTVGLFAAAAVVLAKRRLHARPLLAPMFSPITWVAGGLAVAVGVYLPLRAVDPGLWIWPVLTWIIMLALPVVALAALGSGQYQRLQDAKALDRIRRALADGLEDSSLQIRRSFLEHPRSWVDENGSPAGFPSGGRGRHVTEVLGGDLRLAVLHDPALLESPALLLSAGAYALTVLENEHLTDQLRTSLSDLTQSRMRGVAAEDRERQKIERDLHDGAQQRLVAVRVKLGLAAGRMEERDPAGAEVIRGLGDDVDATIDDVRAFAQGIYPPLLARTGLGEALRAMSRTAALPTVVRTPRLGRYRPEIEMTVYFCCSEALQNVAKHAPGAREVTISVWEGGGLHFEVENDGSGFDVSANPYGTGLGNLRERLTALGGEMAVASSPAGTKISGSIPLA
jgi:signal transduction histidine kinase